jgi:hypothetical protein
MGFNAKVIRELSYKSESVAGTGKERKKFSNFFARAFKSSMKFFSNKNNSNITGFFSFSFSLSIIELCAPIVLCTFCVSVSVCVCVWEMVENVFLSVFHYKSAHKTRQKYRDLWAWIYDLVFLVFIFCDDDVEGAAEVEDPTKKKTVTVSNNKSMERKKFSAHF